MLRVLVFCMVLCGNLFSNVTEDLKKEIQKYSKNKPLDTNEYYVEELIYVFNKLNSIKKEKCNPVSFIFNSSKFVTSIDKNQKPCKIYDLSFPNLTNLIKKTNIASIPVMEFTSRDYLSWLTGDYEKVYKKINSFKENFSENDLKKSWVSKLKFTKENEVNNKSFLLSDLYVENFKFSPAQKKELLKIVKTEVLEQYSFESIINNPSLFLEKIRFSWNEAKRVYDVFVDYDFLPIKSPIAILDFEIQYKYALEKIFRSVIERSLLTLTKFIPEPTNQTVIRLGIIKAFNAINMAYEHHLNHLEEALRMNLAGTLKTELSKEHTEMALDILFAQRSNAIVEYILNKVTGNDINLDELHKLGKKLRYSSDKQRKSTFARLHSNLYTKNKCTDVIVLHNGFGVCKVNDKKTKLYSLMSEHKILFLNLDSVTLHDYLIPSKILIQRITSSFLATGLEFVSLPLPDFLSNQLISIINGFATAGVLDETRLLNNMVELKRSGSSDDFTNYHVKWLFKQNLNPFIARSIEAENRIIHKNLIHFKETF